MTNRFSLPASLPVRAWRTFLGGLWLALLPLLTWAATPVLRLEPTVAAGDVTAFVDQVEIIDATTGLPVRGAVPNAGFETTGSLGAGSFAYNPTGASWSFVNNSGIASNGSAFNNPTAPEGSRVAFLQSGTPGYISQTLPNLVPGLYRVRVRVAQRSSGAANQGVRVLVDGVDLGTVVPVNNGAFAMYNSGTFVVARPSSGIFAGGATLTTNGSTALDVGFAANPAVTDVDGDGLIDLLVGRSNNGTLTRYEQTSANGDIFADLGLLTTNGSTAVAVGQAATPTVTDVDGDGLLDLLVGEYVGTVTRFEQTTANGDHFASVGQLTTSGNTAISSGFQTSSYPTVTDVDGDGLLDLLLGKNGGTLGRYEQTTANGSSFDPVGDLTTPGGGLDAGSFSASTVTDVDGDGLLDLLVGINIGTVRRYEQTAANGGIFADLGLLTNDGSTTLDVGSSATPALADVDGDGRLDLLVGNQAGNVHRYEQAEPPTALALSPQAVAENAASGTAVGTFATTDPTSGDTFTYTLVAGTGDADNASFAIGTGANAGKLVTATVFDFETKSSYLVRVRSTDASGLFTEQAFTIGITDVAEVPVLTSFSPASGALGSTITITGQNLTGLTSVLLGDAPALFTVVSSTSVTVTVPRGATSQKLRISRSTGPVANQGTALSAAVFTVTRPSASDIFAGGAALTTDGSTAIHESLDSAPAVTDLDGNGRLDLLLGNDGGVKRFEQNAVNSLVLPDMGYLTTSSSSPLSTSNDPKLAVTDLDGDGRLDLLIGKNDGTIGRYEQATINSNQFPLQGDLTTDGIALLDVGDKARPAVTDVDSDGLLDLLVGNEFGRVQHYEQTTANGNIFALVGNLTTNGATLLDVGIDASPAVTDLDGDGLLDLLVLNYNGNVRRFEQTTANGSIFAQGALLTTNGSTALSTGFYSTITMTDLDGNGLLDLLLANLNGYVLRYEQADPPTALALSPQAVTENAASGTVVGTFATTDATSGDTFTYTLVTGTGSTDNAQFAIGSGADAGKLVTAAVFDFETKSSYSVRVRSTDASGLFTEQAFTISITDVVEAPTLTSFTPTSGPLGTVLTLTGTNLTGLTSVLVGEVPALFTVNSNTSATATVPRQATSQKVRVSNAAGTALSSTAFTVTRPSSSGIFPAASLTTPGGTPPNVTSEAASTVTDLDGDGLLDLLVGNGSGNVQRFEQVALNGSVFAAVGNLTTNGSTMLDVGTYAVPAVTDLDGDGLLDLLVGNPDGNLVHYEQTLANGDIFAPATNLTTDGSTLVDAGNFACQAVTDLDGDGLLDLLVGNQAGNVQRFEQASPNGTIFNALGNLTTTSGPDLSVGTDAIVKVTDVDGDGLLDLLLGNASGNVQRYEQSTTNGSVFALVGTLTTNGSTLLDVGLFAFAPATDVDGDGLLDLLVGNQAGNVQRFEQADPPTTLALSPQAVTENAASGTVVGTFATTDATPGDTFTYTLVTGTGSTDNAQFAIGSGADAGKLVTAAVFDFETKSSYTVRVRVTDASGLFTEQDFAISITNVVEAPTLTGVAPGTGPLGTTLTLTGTDLTGLTSVLVGEVPALFTVTSNTSATATVPRQATSQRVRVSRTGGPATGQGTALSPTTFTVTRPSTSAIFAGGVLLTDGSTSIDAGNDAFPTVTDVDGNGLLDLLVGTNSGNVLRYEQTTANGSSFAGGIALTTDGSTVLNGGQYSVPVVTDLDGNGRLDLLVGNVGGTVKRYEQTTTNGSSFALVGPLTTNGTTTLDAGSYSAPAVTDLDGNGRLDLLVGTFAGTVQRYEQTAANGSSFALVGGLTTNGSTTLDVGDSAALVATDVDSDGLLDLLVGSASGTVQRYEQTTPGGGTFGLVGNLTTNGSTALSVGQYSAPVVTDVDGDGLLDLLVGNPNGNVRRFEQADPPTALALAPQAVAENEASATVVGTFATTDPTSGDSFTYTLVAGTGDTDNGSFAIGSGADAGKLVTAAVFDFETKSSYTVRVRSTDASGLFTEQAFTISITNVVEMPTITSLSVPGDVASTSVTLTGTNLSNATAVTVNGVAVTPTSQTGTSLVFVVPAGASATQSITVTNAEGTSAAYTSFVVRLQVASTSPAANARTAPVANSAVALTFTEPVTAASIAPSKTTGIKVYSAQVGGLKAGSFSGGGTSTVSYTSSLPGTRSNFKPGEVVSVTVPGTVLGAGGLAATRKVYQFTTATGGTGRGNFQPPASLPNPVVGSSPNSVAVGDVDGDGDLDLLTANTGGGTVSVRLNGGDATGSNTGVFSSVSNFAVGNTPSSVALGDVDGDGDLDMLTAIYGGTVSVRLNGGDATGSNTGVFSNSSNPAVGSQPRSIAVGDVDGDGDLDLLTANANTSGTVSVRLNGGDATGTNTGVFSGGSDPAVGNTPYSVALGDVDGDGDLDLLTANYGTGTGGGTVSVRLNGGDATGSNTGLFSNGSDPGVGSAPHSVAVGDVDNDGDLDLLAANYNSGTVSVRLNGGNATGSNTGVFSNGSNPAVGSQPQSVAFGDVDGDGDLDLIATNSTSPGTVSVRLNGGDATGSNTGVFSGSTATTVGNNPASVALGDVDGDGDLDLIATNANGNTVSVRLNQPPVPTLTALSPAAELPGQAVELTGTNFTSGSSVSFGGVAASSVTYNSATSLTAVVPVGATPGSSTVVVTAAGGSTSSSPAFEVLQVYRSTAASGCLSTDPLTLTGSGGMGAWRYLRLPGAGGAVVAAIEDTYNLGTVTAGFAALGTGTSTAVRTDGRGRAYLDRNFYLTATNKTFTGQTVKVRFFGLSSELARLTAAAGTTAAALNVSQYSGANENCTLSDNAASGESRILPAPAVVMSGADWFTAQVSVADHFSEFYLTGSSSPLPVELTEFTATKQGMSVALHWATASEQNSARFEVERSTDGRVFNKIGEEPAQGDKTSPTAYHFIDTHYPGETTVLYYRLRQVDLDGTFSYSPVRVVAVGGKAVLTLYPNPAHAAVAVAGLSAGASVQVLDALGRAVASGTADADGTARLALPAGLAAGVYVVRSGGQALRLTVE